MPERDRWLALLKTVCMPVLKHGAQGSLHAALTNAGALGKHAYLEAVGRTLCGMAPFLAGCGGSAAEAAFRREAASLAQDTLKSMCSPKSGDFLPVIKRFDPNADTRQYLVDAAFLAQGILRAKAVLFDQLDSETKEGILSLFATLRGALPHFNNWLLFASEIEACLHMLNQPCDTTRVSYAANQFEQWYAGDGMYCDGPQFHCDYYNSIVIHPMLCDLARTVPDVLDWQGGRAKAILRRALRHAGFLLRQIAPDGTYPVYGRSVAYRCGVFHALAQAALDGNLPPDASPAKVRRALGAAISRTLGGAANYRADGFLNIGVCGAQPGLGEAYINTGSLYLCTTAFLPLGLPDTAPFWTDADEETDWERIWSGKDIACDHRLSDDVVFYS